VQVLTEQGNIQIKFISGNRKGNLNKMTMSWSSSLCNYSTRYNASRTDFSVCNDSKKLNQTMVGNAFSREKKGIWGVSNLIGVDRCSYSLWDAHLLAPCYRPLLLQSCLAAPVCASWCRACRRALKEKTGGEDVNAQGMA
jgi:hypothetical protein